MRGYCWLGRRICPCSGYGRSINFDIELTNRSAYTPADSSQNGFTNGCLHRSTWHAISMLTSCDAATIVLIQAELPCLHRIGL